MTDDSSAEKNALKSVWPESMQLLCHFHVAQAEWRWLFSHTEDVKIDESYETFLRCKLIFVVSAF